MPPSTSVNLRTACRRAMTYDLSGCFLRTTLLRLAGDGEGGKPELRCFQAIDQSDRAWAFREV